MLMSKHDVETVCECEREVNALAQEVKMASSTSYL